MINENIEVHNTSIEFIELVNSEEALSLLAQSDANINALLKLAYKVKLEGIISTKSRVEELKSNLNGDVSCQNIFHACHACMYVCMLVWSFSDP